MTEYPIHSRAFVQGLYLSEGVPSGTGILTDCVNVISDGTSLRNFEGIVSFIPSDILSVYGIDINFPFARLFSASENYLISDDLWKFYNNTLVPESVYDYEDKSTIVGIPKNLRWSVSNFGDFWFAVNGDYCIFRDIRSRMLTEAFGDPLDPLVQKIYRTDRIKANATVKSKGRYLLGGFNTDLFGDLIQPVIPDLQSVYKVRNTPPSSFAQNTIYWSAVGGGDFYTLVDLGIRDIGHVYPSIVDSDRAISRLLENFRIGSCGFATMSWRGPVTNMLELGDSVIVYGTDGITSMTPAGKEYRFDDVASFGVEGYAVGGGRSEHILIDSDDTMWSITSQGIKKIGYRQHLIGQQRDRVIVYDPIRDHYYISDGNITFILTRSGLFKTSQVIGDGFVSDSGFLALCNEINAESRMANFRLSPYNMQINEDKFVSSVHVTGEFDSGRARVWYTTRKSKEFKPSLWKRINQKGVVNINVNASDFAIEFEMVGNFDISQITIYYSVQSKTDLRGPYATSVPTA